MHTIVVLLTSTVLVVIDQLLKVWALDSLAGGPSVLLIPGLLQLTYVENRGAAFGIFQGRVGILSIITLAVIIAAIVILLSGKLQNKLSIWSVGLVIAGGAGNLIDRVFRSFVVDYIDISPLFRFPVFNFADCCVVIGTLMLAVYLIFFDGKKPPESVRTETEPPKEPDGAEGE